MAKSYVAPQHSQALIQGGLTSGQASLYETLVQHGPLNARRASFIAGVPRTLGYKILSELEALALVIKNDRPHSVATFTAVHPLKLQEFGEKRLAEAKSAKKALDEAIFQLISDFNRSSSLGAQTLEGPAGLIELLEKQFAQKKPLMTTNIENSPTKLTFSIVFEPVETENVHK